MSDTTEVILQRTGQLGHIILNRPQALNALTHAMVRLIDEALAYWEHDETVKTVLVTGAGERGLCAGGDIVAIYHDALAGTGHTARFWADEYRLNSRIARYPKPYVAIMDGLVLGGGVGISAHGSIRVVTERTRLGMPETGIGFIPDVGGTHLLARIPGEYGTHLALTAGHTNGPEAIELGLADHFVPSDKIAALATALAGTEAHQAVSRFAEPVGALEDLTAKRQWIDRAYAHETVEEILEALHTCTEPAAAKAAAALQAKSPTALKVALAALRAARDTESLEESLEREYRIALRAIAAPDMAEGIRAQVIDKDRNPDWNPATLAEVTAEQVGGYFEPLGEHELILRPTAGQHRA